MTKHNDLIPSLSKMDLQELRLLAFCLSHLRPKHEREFREITASVQELSEIFGMDPKYAYSVIRDVTTKVNAKPVILHELDGTKRIRWWFAGLDYTPGTGRFVFIFNPLLKDKLLDLASGTFTQFRIKDIYQFKSASTWRIYENLRQWKHSGRAKFGILEFKILSGVDEKYSRFGDFNQRILKPALLEINDTSDIMAQCEKITHGRKVTHLIFIIRDNPRTKTPREQVRAVAEKLDSGASYSPELEKLLCNEYRVSPKQARQLANLAKGKEDHVKALLPKLKRRFEKLEKKTTSLGGYVFKTVKDELTKLTEQTQKELPL